ncbi:filament-like plant protein 3 [Iris pallida]|uniref:Filament-like plant protein 3 n=1 Tax=Iris pallida TaxID=29817 RepID=A0AAX6F8I5_IRIPA|nr:filament-like plant protein 3 [Iris pallida]KAJ6812321.1 filament-like plant protein 3 [Iris pallida]
MLNEGEANVLSISPFKRNPYPLKKKTLSLLYFYEYIIDIGKIKHGFQRVGDQPGRFVGSDCSPGGEDARGLSLR